MLRNTISKRGEWLLRRRTRLSSCFTATLRDWWHAMEEYENGFKSWRLLWLRYGPPADASNTTRMTTIRHWRFRDADSEDNLAEWEAEIAKYEDEHNIPMPDEVKVGIVLSNAAYKLRQHLLLYTDRSTSYNDVWDTIVSCYRSGRCNRNTTNQVPSYRPALAPTKFDWVQNVYDALQAASRQHRKDRGSGGYERKGKGQRWYETQRQGANKGTD